MENPQGRVDGTAPQRGPHTIDESAAANARRIDDDLMTVAPNAINADDIRQLVDFPTTAADRYADLGQIGIGGMGEVRRVRDRILGRNLAMKVLTDGTTTDSVLRFLEEASVTAGLQHPAIVPVHDVGVLSDGRFFFTMKEIKGDTLDKRIAAAVEGWNHEGDIDVIATQRELVGALIRICSGVAHAHHRGSLHRDLKPANMILGDFGEVLVLDWGLTRTDVTSMETTARPKRAEGASSRRSSHTTDAGSVIGTPAFMSPEQARGEAANVSPRSDVFALGAVLYNILDGVPPYDGIETSGTPAVLVGPPPKLGSRPRNKPRGPRIPAPLASICERAMAREPSDRYPNAGALAADLSAWLDGAIRRARAAETISGAEAIRMRAQQARRSADVMQRQAADAMIGLPPHAPIAAKREAWVLHDRADELLERAELLDVEFAQMVNAALVQAGDSDLAHAMLAEHYFEKHQRAEVAKDRESAGRFELLLREHDEGRYSAYLDAGGRLSLGTEPAEVTARVLRFDTVDRQLVAVEERELGNSPISEHQMPTGSYVVELSADGYADVTYPVLVERDADVETVRPGDIDLHPIPLPRTTELGLDECYVPAGWFLAGGDESARNAVPGQRLWLDGFITPQFPVTIVDYLSFLNDLADAGRGDEALLHAPPLPAWEEGKATVSGGEAGVMRAPNGAFVLDGSQDQLRLPVTMINWDAATAYAAWRSERDGLPWQLISEMEHEKASRGADGRPFPWGHFLDPTFCCMRLSHSNPGRALRSTVDEFPIDCSVYGIRGLAANVHSWCRDAYSATGPTVTNHIPEPPDSATVVGPGRDGVHRVMKGGSFRDDAGTCRGAYRDAPPSQYRDTVLGLRISRPFPA